MASWIKSESSLRHSIMLAGSGHTLYVPPPMRLLNRFGLALLLWWYLPTIIFILTGGYTAG